MLGISLSKPALFALLIAGLLAVGGVGFWRWSSSLASTIEAAKLEARTERDTYWRQKLTESLAAVEQDRTSIAIRAADLEAELAESRANRKPPHEPLPNAGALGLDRCHVRRLRNEAC